uniref:Peptidase C13 n=1 Tax=Mizugakiibacter sediminis TaxID=1475481 RepID=A0A0S6YZ96_9GAMM
MQDALAKLKPRTPGQVNLYTLIFAGDGGEDVFRNEAEYAERMLGQRFAVAGRTLLLENHPATVDRRPLATWSNLEAALDGLAKVMDPQQDVLLLYFTSHGSEDHTLMVDLDPLPLDQIGAEDLGDILKQRPFKWKVVVVNACYSGGFIPPLRGDGTLVITAARSDRSSFGCDSDSEITYFGRALLADALNRTADFVQAFGYARDDVARWERRDQLTPSEPQIDVGKGIADRLAAWRRTFKPGVPLPFDTQQIVVAR